MLKKVFNFFFGNTSARSAKAVNMFHKAVSDLVTINKEIDEERLTIAERISRLEANHSNLVATKGHNEQMITNIRSIIG
jgi:hypothetical protein